MIAPPDFKVGLPPVLLHDLTGRGAVLWPERTALTAGGTSLTYAALHQQSLRLAAGLKRLELATGGRVAVYLDKRAEAVVAAFGVAAAAGVLVPLNPILKPAQVAHILHDSGARMLITSEARWSSLRSGLAAAGQHLTHVVLCDDALPASQESSFDVERPALLRWSTLMSQTARPGDCDCASTQRALETDLAALFYTSGSTGRAKGVMLSHRNLVAGAASVASYLENHAEDVLLAALPLSFDAGFSQLTTAFLVGARVVLLNYLLPRDLIKTLERERVTGLTAVPPLYMQITREAWPYGAARCLRYWANTGGRLPQVTLEQMKERAPSARPFLMYGLTEAFRATYLPPEEAAHRPESIGRAIPNAEVRVLREDGSECAVDEPGELVQRGPLVALGYWNRPEENARRFRSWPSALLPAGSVEGERAVYSGDTVTRDAEGFLYFVGRRDEMIKTSGYRVSPTEVEEALYASSLVAEVLVYAVPDAARGSAICAAVLASAQASGEQEADSAALLAHCREHLPLFMLPTRLDWVDRPLPRSPNGKLDRQRWIQEHGSIRPLP